MESMIFGLLMRKDVAVEDRMLLEVGETCVPVANTKYTQLGFGLHNLKIKY